MLKVLSKIQQFLIASTARESTRCKEQLLDVHKNLYIFVICDEMIYDIEPIILQDLCIYSLFLPLLPTHVYMIYIIR